MATLGISIMGILKRGTAPVATTVENGVAKGDSDVRYCGQNFLPKLMTNHQNHDPNHDSTARDSQGSQFVDCPTTLPQRSIASDHSDMAIGIARLIVNQSDH